MAQGRKKNNVQVPGKKSKNKLSKHQQKKALGMKKGARQIAPKKARKIEEIKLQKNLTKAIGCNIEKEITAKASMNEAKPFKVFPKKGEGDQTKKKKK
ncbi:UPF0390 protein zgc136864-like [Anneissia japonica]|uniref:UPF0390 protein zgc136864-like n=1 Tax=Anneissia japonica TaxID=1529436 RepID=UPI001425797F|nr:UPF0390 protein zgc136864-like [Anneissia japonica]